MTEDIEQTSMYQLLINNSTMAAKKAVKAKKVVAKKAAPKKAGKKVVAKSKKK